MWLAPPLILPAFCEWRLNQAHARRRGCSPGSRRCSGMTPVLALFGIHELSVIAIAVCTPREQSNKLRTFVLHLVALRTRVRGGHLAGPCSTTCHVAPLQPVVHDLILYPSRYYHRGRNLPFPRIGPRSFENIQVYLPIAAVAHVRCMSQAPKVFRHPQQSGRPLPRVRRKAPWADSWSRLASLPSSCISKVT